MQSLADLRRHADDRLFAGDFDRALHAYAAVVRLQPLDLDARLRVGDTLLALGEVQSAAVVYTALARYATNAGHPLRALVALKVLEALEPQLGQLLRGLADLYASGSARLGRGVRLSLGEGQAALPPGTSLGDPPPRAQLAPVARDLAATDPTGGYPDKLPPIPLFSELPADAFAAVLAASKLVRCRADQVILAQGDPGRSFFVIARGSVQVIRKDDAGEETVLASLHDGAVFGEMALLSSQPRTATVRAIDDCDLFEFDRETLEEASRKTGAIARALAKFTQERLLHNLLATAPLFRPLDKTQRFELARRFKAHDVPAGTPIIREGEPGRGLFVLLHGKVDVWKRDGSEKVLLATLKPGDVFGEISLLYDAPTTATVSAATQATVLFLAKELFEKLVTAIDSIRAYVEQLGEERMMDTQILMTRDDAEALSEDDLVFL